MFARTTRERSERCRRRTPCCSDARARANARFLHARAARPSCLRCACALALTRSTPPSSRALRAESQSICSEYKGGQGGWPTLVSFTKASGLAGIPYAKKTSGMVCDELKVEKNLRAHVEATLAGARAAADL